MEERAEMVVELEGVGVFSKANSEDFTHKIYTQSEQPKCEHEVTLVAKKLLVIGGY